MEQKDPLTGEVFYPKRTNQQFASRKNQIRYNNLKAYKKRKAKSGVERLLDKNRTILSEILGNETEVIRSKDFLLGAGFHFGCQTHSIRKNNEIWKCVYDYAFISDGNSIKITKNA